ncbi:hypothetical protein KJ780_01160 [Candidatus Micrarchaeota archaeon]|nr:hypothetical protein [Candidatus Micrarchaeota archaeon]
MELSELLIYASLLWFLGYPLFWFWRHYVHLKFKASPIKMKVVAYAAMLIFDIFVLFSLGSYVGVRHELPEYAPILGWSLILLWAFLELWARYQLFISMKSWKTFEISLVSKGPFSIVRHPIFLAGLFFNFGAYLATGSVICLGVFVEWLILMKPLADMEDDELELRFEEEFTKYRKKVPQLIPKLK